MAKKVQNFRQAGRSLRHPNSKYPWTRWLKGGAWEAKEGEDFSCAPNSFVAILRAKGAENGLRLRTRRGKNNRQKTIIIFEFYEGKTTPVAAKKIVKKKSAAPPKKKIVIRRSSTPAPEVSAEEISGCAEACSEGHTYEPPCEMLRIMEAAPGDVLPEESSGPDVVAVEPVEACDDGGWDNEESTEDEEVSSPDEDSTPVNTEEEEQPSPVEIPEQASDGPCAECGRFNGKHESSCPNNLAALIAETAKSNTES